MLVLLRSDLWFRFDSTEQWPEENESFGLLFELLSILCVYSPSHSVKFHINSAGFALRPKTDRAKVFKI